ncbi:cytochrome d ubiquinol oxidase subunit II [Amycolatopsis acidiphila]|uniref:Cytochrome d ubiquinol oxidase subunit II n=1 Tax=Amycolatopsis acidiphila TaxID=715473 RepID=A0A558AMP5_9PSEU|nr:cytochrome d ubiquinol oxidase subunit II [Amycolatopsis acidiphila]TVT25500.1 cytochrome d ubiquinol oxidase subunit II [Amycolatopsis acidiphila]UIJ60240.1 cytochrome d ubiquinol oxidase subunit II [Amycolatopsis acidiphila]GHG60559.1 cytochrome c oxidase assembly protein [Amycolatopsis acidiphila]
MSLETLWFCIIVLFWLGYLFLEGFDFGVGMLLPVLGRDDTERRVMINTIGPVWDGNEVWLIVAAGAMFAAFPDWYASLFSGAYLPLLLVLLALIGRGVAFEYRGKVDSPRWRRNWDRVIVLGSWLPPLGVGLLITTTVLGLPLDEHGNRIGSAFAAVRWDTLLGALAVVGFSLVHGAAFLALKTGGELRDRARLLAIRVLPVALVPLVVLLLIVQFREGALWTVLPLAVAVGAAVVAWRKLVADRDGQAFAALGVTIAAAVVTLFGALYPDVLPSTADPANSLTVAGAASSHYALQVITWVAAFGAPAVLVYQGWTYWVFRKRISTAQIPPVHTP